MRNKLLLLLVLIPNVVFAQFDRSYKIEQQPKAEIGIGAIGLNTPLYPGSSVNRFRVIPFPWFKYRGDVFRLDEEGQRLGLTTIADYEIGMGFNFNFPVKAKETEIRTGMPDIDFVFGLGPTLILRLLRNNDRQKLNLSFGMIAKHSVDDWFKLTYRGFAFEPALTYWRKLGKKQNVNFFANLSLELGSKRYNRFYYEVAPEFATADRPQFSAKAGLIQYSYSMGISYAYNDKLQFYLGGSYRDLHGAANRRSALVEKRNNAGVVLGFTWLFFESDERATSYKNKDVKEVAPPKVNLN